MGHPKSHLIHWVFTDPIVLDCWRLTFTHFVFYWRHTFTSCYMCFCSFYIVFWMYWFVDCSTRGKKGELYCFVERDPNKSRQKRSVDKEFFWRTTNSSMITDEARTVKGQKTSLVFHSGRGKGTKTEWMMQEYCLIAAASPEGYSSSAKDKKMEKVRKQNYEYGLLTCS